MLRNIRNANRDLAIFSTGRTNIMGDLPTYGTVWFHPGGITNILLLSKVVLKYRVCSDSNRENYFPLHLPRGEMRHFRQCPRGIFFYEMTDSKATVLVNYVEYNHYRYSDRGCYRALEARNLQYKVALSRHRHLIKIIENNIHMEFFLFNHDDVKGADKI